MKVSGTWWYLRLLLRYHHETLRPMDLLTSLLFLMTFFPHLFSLLPLILFLLILIFSLPLFLFFSTNMPHPKPLPALQRHPNLSSLLLSSSKSPSVPGLRRPIVAASLKSTSSTFTAKPILFPNL